MGRRQERKEAGKGGDEGRVKRRRGGEGRTRRGGDGKRARRWGRRGGKSGDRDLLGTQIHKSPAAGGMEGPGDHQTQVLGTGEAGGEEGRMLHQNKGTQKGGEAGNNGKWKME